MFSIFPLYNLDADRPKRANATAIPRCLPVSGGTVRSWLLERYQTAREHLRNSILLCNTAIHISFDLWTSPNHRTFMAIVGHYLNISTGLVQAVLLSFRRLRGPHSGENQAAMFWSIAEDMQLTRCLGYFTLDNATSNDSAWEHIAQRSRSMGVPFEPKQHRIRCLGHVINLTVKSLIWGHHSVTIDNDLLEEYTDQEDTEKEGQWRRYGPLGKL
jgi:hypothetical protein